MQRCTFRMQDIQTRDDLNENPTAEGYFVVFDSTYNICEGVTESISRGAFDDSINDDVRALFNHNSDLILGRTSANTLELRQDDKGLWGRIYFNRDDSDAMNAYARIKRGDVTGCSFGFEIAEEDKEVREDKSVHFTIRKVKPLYEVSPCVFPAYKATSIGARDEQDTENRKEQAEALLKEQAQAELDTWKNDLMAKLGGKNA